MTTVAGFGFRYGATLASLRDALAQALAAAAATALTTATEPTGPTDPTTATTPPMATATLRPIVLFAAPQDKADAACLRALADELGLPVHAVEATVLNATPTLTDSARVRALRGSGSSAEAAALAAALLHGGPGAKLLHPRAVSTDRLATCAIATCAITTCASTTPAPQPTLES